MAIPKFVIQELEDYKCVFEGYGVDADNDLQVNLLGTIAKFDGKVTFISAVANSSSPGYVPLSEVRSANDEEIALLEGEGFDREHFNPQKQLPETGNQQALVDEE